MLPARVSDHHRQESSHADHLGFEPKPRLTVVRNASRRQNLSTLLAGKPMLDFESCFTGEHLAAHVESLLDGHFDVIAECPRISTGADRIELDLFRRDQAKHLTAISRKVIDGRYTFSPFLERHIPKPESKEMRTISVASIRDSIVQRCFTITFTRSLMRSCRLQYSDTARALVRIMPCG